LKRACLAVRQIKDLASKITWDFQPVSQGKITGQAYIQAQKFGAKILIADDKRLFCEHKPYIVKVENGAGILSHTIIIATEAEYQRLPLKNLSRFEGLGIYYATTLVDAQSCDGREAIEVGGRNSAGQDAVFLEEGKARSHADKVRWFGQEYVSLFDSPNQRELYDCTLAKHRDHDIGRRQTS